MKRLLVTGFGRFPGAPANPTQALVTALARRRRPALAGIELLTAVLPVTWAQAPSLLRELIARHSPDAVLMFGLAGRARRLRIECRAVNSANRLHPDAAGRLPAAWAIEPGGPARRVARMPAARLRQAMRGRGVTATISQDAGTYLCNAALWTALAATPSHVPVAFLHVPPLAQRLPRARIHTIRLRPEALKAAAMEAVLTVAGSSPAFLNAAR